MCNPPTCYLLRMTHVSYRWDKHWLPAKQSLSSWCCKLFWYQCSMRFEVLTAVSMKTDVFWVVVPWSLVEVYRHFRGAWCLWNVSKLLPDYTTYQPRRQPSSVQYVLKRNILNCFKWNILCVRSEWVCSWQDGKVLTTFLDQNRICSVLHMNKLHIFE
jgi:hypothetical protein